MVRSYLLEDTPFEKFDSLVHTIQTIGPAELQALAERYLQKEDFWTVVVG
jgi:predicted Zn-dependent peptidase